ncbi:transcriptional regulator [uncultured Rothia sp.]|uniref:transcriptional regulator n=1 Tax=uncultured Rothia sp. TaxID=316088 RepID=UPI0028D25B9D|nr:transcriptional regulator [uncultured Rothia sp.]
MSTPSEKNPAPVAEDGTRAPIELKYNPHEGVEEPYLILPGGAHGAAVVKDLATYISRALAVNPEAAIRLTARGRVLAVFACSLEPEDASSTAPVIMGMRALHLAAESTLDMTVQAQALQERLARLQKQAEQQSAEQQNPELVLYMPPVTVNAGWTGKAAPVRGWSEVGTVPVEEFARATAEGLEAVDRALPENPGAAVLTTVRSRIWSSPMVLEYLPAFDGVQVPTGAAFALRVYGFIPEGFTGELPVFAARVGSDEWLRIVAPAGMVLVRRGSGSLI